MKKIFAIALALVMVLSMASAFASACTTGFDWSCSTTTNKCGKATVEVVPYVKVNNSCGGFDWQASECASAVNSEKIYYAVKLTVDANPDQEWFDKATVKLTYKGMKDNTTVTLSNIGGVPAHMAANDVDDVTSTYYYNFTNNAWSLVNDDFEFGTNNVDNRVVKKASEAKVCVTLASATDGFSGGIVGNYYVTYADGKIVVMTDDQAKTLVTYTIKDEKVKAINYTSVCGEDDYATIKAFMGLEIGTCVTDDAIDANFGWDDEVKDCFTWGSNAAAIVDADCVVAIPKTGDVSVVAYAVMAVVAAAGTMLKK